MKSRQEMIYDFMVALSANSEFYRVWDTDLSDSVGSFGTHVQAFAEELANKYLENIA